MVSEMAIITGEDGDAAVTSDTAEAWAVCWLALWVAWVLAVTRPIPGLWPEDLFRDAPR